MNLLHIGRCVLFHKRLKLLRIDYKSKSHVVNSKNIKIISYGNQMPKSVKKLFLPNKNKLKQSINTVPERKKVTLKLNSDLRVNSVNMQMLSRNLYEQIFKNDTHESDESLVESCLMDLRTHGIQTQESEYMPDVQLELPKLEGENIEEHFWTIGEQQSAPYRNLVNDLIVSIPDAPNEWLLQTGWTRYAPGEPPTTVSYPAEDAVVFDVEICMKAGPFPALATAVSSQAWYAWISQAVVDGNSKPLANRHCNLSDLIPLESDEATKGYDLKPGLLKPKIVVGHNVSFDRLRIKEQYWFEKTGMRFLDTMSLHVCVSGITSYQRAILQSGKDDGDDAWKSQSSLNSLSEVHKLYCGTEVDKETRNVFLEGTMADVKERFQEVMRYCANDVRATYNVTRVLFPMFLERFPHPVTLAGLLELGTAYLHVNSNWTRYIDDCEQTYEDLNSEAKFLLVKRADHACQLMHEGKYKEDLWMWDQDWSTQDFKMKKSPGKTIKSEPNKNETPENSVREDDDLEVDPLEDKFKYLMDKSYLPARRPHLPGYPLWYRKLCTKPTSDPEWLPGPHLISTSMQVTPKLLCLTWEGFPLHYIRDKGWGLLVPHSTHGEDTQIPLKQLLERCPLITGKPSKTDATRENLRDLEKELSRREWWRNKRQDKTDGAYKGTGVWCNTDLEECVWFLKLPHKDGASFRVGNPLARDFLNKFSDNILAGEEASAEKVLAIARTLSYWRNNRDRIMEQQVVWLRNNEIPKSIRLEDGQFGVILPLIVVCGTLTRRAMEPTWMTASNAIKDRLGSELRSMIQAPPGYNIVGADVDSQELWIASVIGDSHRAKMHGATPLGWMTLIGTKSNGTDMHSMTAKAVGISRDHAKVINYARIYGAGQNFAERLLKQFNPAMTEGEARSKAVKMFSLTKGKKVFRLKKEYLDDLEDKPYSTWQAYELAKLHGKRIEEVFNKPKWVGGSESAMFNRLEEIAGNMSPVTPFLESRLSRALEPKNMPDDRFLPTRVNWVVQSGAVDFLHLMLVSMKWLMKGKSRFCLSFHDEIRYLVPEELRYDAALAMQITNLLTRSFCCARLGINDLPQSVAFFSSVEVDTVLRKEAHLDCKTPSNPHGLNKGYGVPDGESLNIQKCIEKTGGQLSLWSTTR